MNVLLFEDERVGQLAPATIGRPAYAVSCGSFRLIELVRELGAMRRLVRPHLRGVETADSPDEMLADGPLDGPTLLVNTRLVPSPAAIAKLRALIAADREGIVASGESVAGALVKRRLEIPEFGDGAPLPAMVRKLSLPSVTAELPLFD
jgi:hypothetical protein